MLHSLPIYDSVHHLFTLFNTAKDKLMELGLPLCHALKCKFIITFVWPWMEKLDRMKRDLKITLLFELCFFFVFFFKVDFLKVFFFTLRIIFPILHCEWPGQEE